MPLDETEEFRIENYHVELLKKSYTSWDNIESGAPSIDPKRPYGSKEVDKSIAKVLGIEDQLYNERGYRIGNDGDYEELYQIHEEMETVLSILLDNPVEGIETGLYRREKYGGDDWDKVD